MSNEQAVALLEKAIADVRAGDLEAFDKLAGALDDLGIDIDDDDGQAIISGDKVEGSKFDIGAISNATGVAIGHNIQMVINESALPSDLEARLNKVFDLITSQRVTRSERRHIRIFISSPGDVVEERGLALKVIQKLPYDPLLRGRVTIEPIAWDKPDSNTPMLATMTPQEAINQGLARPSDCDIVVVIFWSRMGTPLPQGYEKPAAFQFDPGFGILPARYLSGTEWEYVDAILAAQKKGRPLVIVYRRTSPPVIAMDDSKFDEKRGQWKLVERFFETFTNPDGSIRQGYNFYASPDEFEKFFEQHVRELIARLLLDMERQEIAPNPSDEKLELWDGSPFPGLRPFGPADAPIFFGRNTETVEVLNRLRDQRFTAVVGASGSGKSSLVWAGVIPRLMDNAIEGSKDWLILRVTPDELGAGDPFASLAAALIDEPVLSNEPRLADRLAQDPDLLGKVLMHALPPDKPWAETLLFLDQFEELFTRVGQEQREQFVRMLEATARNSRVRIILTLRADFYTRCVEMPMLAELVKSSTYPLAAPRRDALREMIERPAARAGLSFEAGLVKRILDDTGDNPGSLALLAFALQQLFEKRDGSGRLSVAAYESFGGVRGAIGQQAQQAFDSLPGDSQVALPVVFRELVTVDDRGTPTRRRALLSLVASEPGAAALVEQLTERRLLVQSRDEQNRPIVEVAHEALFTSWPRLHQWIEETADDLNYGSNVLRDAQAWEASSRDVSYLLRGTQLEIALGWWERAERKDIINDLQRDFVRASRDEQRRRAEAEEQRRKNELLRLRALIILLAILASLAVVFFFQSQRNLARAETFLNQANANATEVGRLIQLAAAQDEGNVALATQVADVAPPPTETPTMTPVPEAAAEETAAPSTMSSPTPEATATIDPVQLIVRAVLDFDRENVYMLTTGDTSTIDKVTINPELLERLETAQTLRLAGNCVWAYQDRGIRIEQIVMINDITADVLATLDRDGTVFCNGVERPEYAFTGPTVVVHTVTFQDGRWIVSDRRNFSEGG